MGDAAEDILCSFKLSDEQSKSYETVLAKFHGYFVKKRNFIFERAKSVTAARGRVSGRFYYLIAQFVRVLQLWAIKRGNDSGSNRRWSSRLRSLREATTGVRAHSGEGHYFSSQQRVCEKATTRNKS